MSEPNDVDEETFGDSATDANATVGLPDFFTTKGTAGDEEFTNLMQDLKNAALADAGADSGAGGLDGLLDPRDLAGLPEFFKTDAGSTLSATGNLSAGGGVVGGDSSLFDPLSSFDLGDEGQEDDGADLLATLGLDRAIEQRRREQQEQRQLEEREHQEQQRHQRDRLEREKQEHQRQLQEEERVEDLLSSPSGGEGKGGGGVDIGDGGVLVSSRDDDFGETEQSDWDRMQKQFEDMHKSFLQDYRQIEEEGDDGALDSAADEGKQTAFATMRQLSLDDLDPSPGDDPESALPTQATRGAAEHIGVSSGSHLTGPSVLPPGAKTLEELEAEFAAAAISTPSASVAASTSSPRVKAETPLGLTQSDRLGVRSGSGTQESQGVAGDKRVMRGIADGEERAGGGDLRREDIATSQGMAWGQAHQPEHQHPQPGYGQHGSSHIQQQQQQSLVGQAQPGDGAPQGNLHGARSVAPSVGQHQGGGMPPSFAPGRGLSPVGRPSPSPRMAQGQAGHVMAQGRPPAQQPQHQQQQQQHSGFSQFPPPGMPPFHTLPPHVQAHLMQQQAIAHARSGAPRTLHSPAPPPRPPRFVSASPRIPTLPPQQQQQQQHSGMALQRPGSPIPMGGGVLPRGVPVMISGQQQMFSPREGGAGSRVPPGLGIHHHSPTPRFARPPMPPPSPILTPQQQMQMQQQHHHHQMHHQMQHQQHQGVRPDARPPLPPLEMFPRGEFMTAYDTRYVIMAQMRALETPDPFNDDFYFHNTMRRKQEKSRREGLIDGDAHVREAASPMPMPLPVWQETKEIARKVKDEQADAVKKRIRQWESENRVLGHHARSDVHRPRALLVLSGAGGEGEEGEAGSSDGEVLVSGGAPFETHLWRARQAIQLATDAMLAAYELNYLLHLPTTPPAKKVEVAGRLRDVIVDLAVSLGLKRSTILQQEEGKPPPDASTLEASLDLRVLSTVLELTKGQKLLSRCLVMLPPWQRSALVPSVLALTLARAPAASLRNAPSEQVKADAIKAEEALASELKNVVQSPASLPLPILRRCVELVMTAHRGKGSLAAALGSVSRAEVLGAVLRKGGELSEAEGGEAAADWAALQSEFIAMAKETPPGSQ